MSDQHAVQVDEKSVLEIIRNRNIHTFFQPIVSISTKSIIGFEAFSRGGGGDVCVIDPKMLFHDDLSAEVKVDVDRLCREKAIEQFKPIHSGHQDMMLFLNVNPDILPHVEAGSKVLKHQVASMDVDMANVAIECPLCKANSKEIADFAALYRDFGFKISLDNCGVDDSFSHAISVIKPAFVKITPSFFANDSRKSYSAKALESVVEVADRVGAVVIAQGVESEDDSIRLLTAGVHLQQGYYYTKDEDDRTGDPARMFFRKIVDTYDKYKRVKRELVRKKKERFDVAFKAVTSVCSKFSNIPESRFEDACKTLVRNVDGVISMFVLDETGEQITLRSHAGPEDIKAMSAKILGSDKGVDHSVRDYFLYLDMGYEKFVTQPFTSQYTGDEACIISKPFYNSEGLRYVVCIEMPYPG